MARTQTWSNHACPSRSRRQRAPEAGRSLANGTGHGWLGRAGRCAGRRTYWQQCGQLPVTSNDIHALPEVIAHPDRVLIGVKNDRGLQQLVSVKALEDGSTLPIEEARTHRRNLAVVSVIRYPGTIDASRLRGIFSLYVRNDTGEG